MKLLLICLDGLRIDLALPRVMAADERFILPDEPADSRFSTGGADHTVALRQAEAFGVVAPTLARLAVPGAVGDAVVLPVWMTPPTDSGPGWSSLLTGSTHEQCNVWWNEFIGHRLAERPDILTRVWAANPAARTLVAADWDAFASAHGPGPIVQQRVDQQATGQHRVVTIPEDDLFHADIAVRTRAAWLLNHEGPDASIVYLQNTDHAAHLHGSDSAEYRQAIREADEHVRHLVKAVAERHEALGEDWLVAVVTDHGHKPEGGHGEDEVEVRRSFLLLHRLAGSLPRWLHHHEALLPHQVCDVLLRTLGISPASWQTTHEVGRLVDVPSAGPSRDIVHEW